MHAHDRFLPEWFGRIKARQITLPRFQRMLAWGNNEISGLLTTVLRGLPSGATLLLEVGDEEKFKSRTMVDAPEDGAKVTEQLLDGQQRLTALWRSFHDKYPDRTYLVGFEDDPHDPTNQLPFVFGQARWTKNGKRYPMWVDSARECWQRRMIPVRLLCPEDMPDKDQWIEAAIPSDAADKFAAFKEISSIISDLRTKVREFNLPYLSLAPSTPKDVALDVFIKMNTSSVKLSTYDIIVALVEEETGKSLHDHVDAVQQAVPRAGDYADLPGLVLDVVALRQDRTPSQAGYQRIDFTRMMSRWEGTIDGIKGAVRFLEEESIFDGQRLPSYTAVPIVAALWEHLPTHPDKLGNARHILRKYLWRAFLVSRYEQSSTTNALQDFRALRNLLQEKGTEADIPIFDEDSYPLPTKETIIFAEWPKRKTILGRGLLALQLKCGAEDLADGARATVATITSKEHPREYHHLFPDSTLSDAEIPDEQIYRTLNCALITWRTNRTISNKDPIAYLKERADNAALGEEELRRRLRTHLIPYEKLAVGNYQDVAEAERNVRIKADYEAFLAARAELFEQAARFAAEGRALDLGVLFPANG